MNDKTGRITGPLRDGRFPVDFADNPKPILIKEANLVELPKPLIFQSKEAFSNLVAGPPKDGYATRQFASMDVPVYIFRADRKQTPTGFVPNAAPVSNEFPMFVSDLDSIGIYTRVPPGSGPMNPSTLSRYTLTKNPVLFDMSPDNLDRLLADPKVQGESGMEDLKQWYFVRADLTKAPKSKYPPTVSDLVRNGVVKGTETDIPVLTPKLDEVYLNRLLSNMLCKLGFDGWVVMPGAFLQRFPIREYRELPPAVYQSDFAKGKLKFFYTPYPPEVMLCKWDSFSTWAKAFGGRRKTRSKKRRTRRSNSGTNF